MFLESLKAFNNTLFFISSWLSNVSSDFTRLLYDNIYVQ